MFRCQTAGCGKSGEDINDFVISGKVCVCIPCAERINEETERRQLGNGEEAPTVNPNLSDEEDAEMTVERVDTAPTNLTIEKK